MVGSTREEKGGVLSRIGDMSGMYSEEAIFPLSAYPIPDQRSDDPRNY